METGNVNKRLIEDGKGTALGNKTKKMAILGSSTLMNFVKIALAVAFVGVNIVLYKQSTHIAIAQFLGYPLPHDSNVHRWTSTNLTNSSRVTVLDRSPNLSPGGGTGVKLNLEENTSEPLTSTPPSPSSPHASSPLRKHHFLSEEIINPHTFNYTIFPKVTCSNRVVELAICVPISRNNFKGRQIVRETWGSYANSTDNKAVLVFFIGSEILTADSSIDTQSRIDEEARLFGDILQESYIDHYNNLSLKSVSILKWVTSFCSGSRYILKADDDMYVNVPLLVKILPEVALSQDQSAFVVGAVQYRARPIRNSNSKWYTPYSMFKGEVYPNYASGTAYAMTVAAAQLLYEASLRVPLFWLEDIYITGICALKSEVSVVNSNLFSYSKPDASGCSFRAHISGHRYTLDEIRLIHRELYDPRTVCERALT